MLIEANVVGSFLIEWYTVGASIVPLSTSPLASARGVQLKAASTNTGIIYVGGPGVVAGTGTDGGFPLAAHEEVFIPIDHLENVFFVSDTASQKLCALILS